MADLARIAKLLGELTDAEDDCHLTISLNGRWECQEHGWFGGPGERCGIAEAKLLYNDLCAELGQKPGDDYGSTRTNR